MIIIYDYYFLNYYFFILFFVLRGVGPPSQWLRRSHSGCGLRAQPERARGIRATGASPSGPLPRPAAGRRRPRAALGEAAAGARSKAGAAVAEVGRGWRWPRTAVAGARGTRGRGLWCGWPRRGLRGRGLGAGGARVSAHQRGAVYDEARPERGDRTGRRGRVCKGGTDEERGRFAHSVEGEGAGVAQVGRRGGDEEARRRR